MKKYEYRLETINGTLNKVVEKANELGQEGWRMIFKESLYYYFEREIDSQKPTDSNAFSKETCEFCGRILKFCVCT